MKFLVVSLFPEMIEGALGYGLMAQAREKGLIEVETLNPRQFAGDKYKSVDDRPFGGGDGMAMQAEILQTSMSEARKKLPEALRIYLSPQGETLNEEKVLNLAKHKTLILLSGRYGGVDQRLLNTETDCEISIGDYVLNGGELAALVLIEAVARKIPGVLGHEDSADQDSFGDGLLEAPMFTRPQEWRGQLVPDILLSGNHGAIKKWRENMAWLVTYSKRVDLFLNQLHCRFGSKGSSEKRKFLKELVDFYLTLSAGDRRSCGLPELEFDSLEGFDREL